MDQRKVIRLYHIESDHIRVSRYYWIGSEQTYRIGSSGSDQKYHRGLEKEERKGENISEQGGKSRSDKVRIE